jgi:hypothetical protein
MAEFRVFRAASKSAFRRSGERTSCISSKVILSLTASAKYQVALGSVSKSGPLEAATFRRRLAIISLAISSTFGL